MSTKHFQLVLILSLAASGCGGDSDPKGAGAGKPLPAAGTNTAKQKTPLAENMNKILEDKAPDPTAFFLAVNFHDIMETIGPPFDWAQATTSNAGSASGSRSRWRRNKFWRVVAITDDMQLQMFNAGIEKQLGKLADEADAELKKTPSSGTALDFNYENGEITGTLEFRVTTPDPRSRMSKGRTPTHALEFSITESSLRR